MSLAHVWIYHRWNWEPETFRAFRWLTYDWTSEGGNIFVERTSLLWICLFLQQLSNMIG